MSDYVLNEADIAKAINWLKIHDPQNADRDYAIQKLETMLSVVSETVRSGEISDEQLKQAFEKPDKTD